MNYFPSLTKVGVALLDEDTGKLDLFLVRQSQVRNERVPWLTDRGRLIGLAKNPQIQS